MHVIAHDPFISADLAGRFGVELVSIDELCAASDYLTLHLPATADTHHLFNDERFARCKPGVRLNQHGPRRARGRTRAPPCD